MQDIVELILRRLLNFFSSLDPEPVPGNDLFCLVAFGIFGNGFKLYEHHDVLTEQPGVLLLEVAAVGYKGDFHFFSFSFAIFRASRFAIFDTRAK